MKLKYCTIFFLIAASLNAGQITPLQKSDYKKITSYRELMDYVNQLSASSKIFTMDTLAVSKEGRVIPVIKISSGIFGKDKNKLKVLIFAQQHGNEQAGKEGSLLLLNYLSDENNRNLLDYIDLALVPQMNPDGSEMNQRRNGNNMDLNRNHLILTEPETIGLHKLFNKYLFEVTMDVHEYYPYGETYKQYGYRGNSDIEVGTLTNINISEKIRNLSDQEYIPFIKKYLKDHNYSFFEYCPGGPPGIDYIRRSTFDINDGRQSFGIQNSFSFIQEGMNGEDSFIDNIQRRAEAQMSGMLGLIEFISLHKEDIKKLVNEEREKLIKNNTEGNVAIQLDHFSDGTKLQLPLLSYKSNNDTVITVDDYRSVIKSLWDAKRPAGYLIPKKIPDLKEWADNHGLSYSDYKINKDDIIEQYFITGIDKIDFERDTIANPIVELKEVKESIMGSDYYFIPTNQLKNNSIVIALEPKSELGIVTYKQFEYLVKKGEYYPILRVIR